MAISEVNAINLSNPNASLRDTDNYPKTLANPNASLIDTANYKTSDELKVGENNVDYGASEYAKRKRTTKIVTKLTAFTALLITAIASGSFIYNSFLGKDPIIDNFEQGYVFEDLHFNYSFNITIESSYLTMEIYDSGILLPDVLEFKESGLYEGSIPLNEGTDYVFKFVSTNGFDYSSEISKYRITFSTKA